MNFEISPTKPVLPELVPGASVRGMYNSKYPFGKMEVGDAFPVPEEDRARVQVAACHFGTRHGKKYSVRKDVDGQYWAIRKE